jgi:hypothetical protein
MRKYETKLIKATKLTDVACDICDSSTNGIHKYGTLQIDKWILDEYDEHGVYKELCIPCFKSVLEFLRERKGEMSDDPE